MSDLDVFREEVRAWLVENCPPSMRTPMGNDEDVVWGGRKANYKNPEAKLWLDRMGAKGWTAPTWPKEYGGGGLSKEEASVLGQELGRINARPALASFGLWMLGPVLLEYATDEQLKEHLPPIVRGEIRWCQGYSEPGAGSDLAGLQTRAVLEGDEYVINGQKVWTSYADKADAIFCLVRTDTSTKHEGISFLLIDMDQAGVTTKPIKLISGNSPFCETFLDDARTPARNLIGRLNGGWEIAKKLLQHERTNISAGGFGAGGRSAALEEVAKEYLGAEGGKIADAVKRDEVVRHKMLERAFAQTLKRMSAESKAGEVSPASSIIKYVAAEMNKDRMELLVEIMGLQALGWSGDYFSAEGLATTRGMLRSKANSIEGGTTEVNLNVIAKRVLGLRDHQ
ncbi:MAG: acyl-CoA dehydrogenase [Alphaproteobacteria bacterium]|nr:MAG: acyl-CoA dehydrogenase [Alphaproteobacteria bacterium]